MEYTMDDRLEVIDAFVDGEFVSPAHLKAALAMPECRDHLVDVLVLRGILGAQRVGRSVSTLPDAPFVRRRNWSRWTPAAAVVALIGGITGYVAGTRSTPPTPARQPATSSAPAPVPTEVIQLRAGVDWTEKVGGR
jgi:hypothetical protein